MELDWVNADVYDPSSSSGAFPSPPFAGLASVEDFASVCTFYTTYNPSFHSSEQTDENGLLPPILDTGATHCLLPSSWLSPEQAAFSKRIHLRVASGTSVRALLYHNIIYCKTVSRPLLSVGQLKAMLDLRFLWDDSSPCLVACSGGLRYVLLHASVIHHLPVVAISDMHVLLEAIHVFTESGLLWDARQWAKKLGRKLSLFHVGSPTTTLPPDHADFTSDPQVNFSSLDAMPLAFSNDMPLAFSTTTTVQIEEVVEDEKLDDKSMQETEGRKSATTNDGCQPQPLPFSSSSGYYFEDAFAKNAVLNPLNNSSTSLTPEDAEGKSTTNFDSVSKPETLPSGTTPAYHLSAPTVPSSSDQLGTDSSTCLSPELPQAFAITTGTFRLNDETLQAVDDEIQVLLKHSLPKSRTRTNVVTNQYTPRGRLFGAYTTRGLASTHATWRFPEVVEAIMKLANTRPDGSNSEPFLSAQLNAATSLPIHKDKNNVGRSWLIALGNFEGGRLWVESPVGLEPPPSPAADWQKHLRGEYHNVQNTWVSFDPSLYHCVEQVTKGERRSVALFSPKGWKKLSPQCIDELSEVGFNPPLSAQAAIASANALPALVSSQPLPPLAALAPAQGPFQGEASCPSFATTTTTTMQAMTLTLPDDDELDALEEWCREEFVSLSPAELPASDGVLLPLSPTEQQELNDHLQTGHLKKTNLCRGCLEAEGPRKIHKSVRDIDKATHTLHIDIAGPLVTSDDGYVYFLVGALRMPGFPLMIDARPLTSRTSTEVCDELEKLVAFFEALQSEGFAIGETNRIKRIHSDRAGEFTAPYFSRFLANHKTIHHSFTSGYDPQSNGTAERSVGLIKSLAARSLCTSGLDSTYWSYAVRYAAQSLLCQALQIRQKSLPFGASVVAQVLGHRDVKFPQPRSLTGRLLFWDHLHDGTSYVLCPPEDDVSDPLVHKASLPVKLPPPINVDELEAPKPLPAKKKFDHPLAPGDDLQDEPKDLDPDIPDDDDEGR